MQDEEIPTLFLMMEMAGSTGTDVKRAFKSYHVIRPLSSSQMDFTYSTNPCVFLMWHRECPHWPEVVHQKATVGHRSTQQNINVHTTYHYIVGVLS